MALRCRGGGTSALAPASRSPRISGESGLITRLNARRGHTRSRLSVRPGTDTSSAHQRWLAECAGAHREAGGRPASHVLKRNLTKEAFVTHIVLTGSALRVDTVFPLLASKGDSASKQAATPLDTRATQQPPVVSAFRSLAIWRRVTG